MTGIHRQLFNLVFNFRAPSCFCCRNVLAWAVQSKHSPVQSVDPAHQDPVTNTWRALGNVVWAGMGVWYCSEERVANASKKGKQRKELREQNPKSVIQIATCAMCKLESHQECILKHFLQCLYVQLQCAAVLP